MMCPEFFGQPSSSLRVSLSDWLGLGRVYRPILATVTRRTSYFCWAETAATT